MTELQKVKQQLIQHIESTFPEDKKAQALAQINSMNDEQLIQFLQQNNLIQDSGQPQQCVFCSIVDGKIPSYKINENTSAIAVLELNPISKAHTIIIPKQHISNQKHMPKQVLELASQISKQIEKKFKPKKVIAFDSNMFGHEIINLLPIYDNETPESPRQKAEEKNLLELQKALAQKPKPKTVRKPRAKKISSKKLWLPKRIP